MPSVLTLETLQEAVDRLRPELPILLGPEYPDFAARLDDSLKAASVNRVLDLFGRHTAAHKRLLDVLPHRKEELTKGLFGDINISLPELAYLCPTGPHILRAKRVEQHDTAGQPICPDHRVPMRRIDSQQLRAAIEVLRPQLEQLVGPDFQTFAAQLDAKCLAADDNGLWGLFSNNQAANQQLIKILSTT